MLFFYFMLWIDWLLDLFNVFKKKKELKSNIGY